MRSRQEILDTLRAQPQISVLIVGAGVNGIGTFRELALQGVDVLIVDKADFSSGASAASSHMLHGGLRYLENAEFRLVSEALIERNRMLLNAPHYAKPLPTTIPIFSWFSGMFNAPLKFMRLRNKPAERGAFIIKAGLTMYDWFTRTLRVMPTHRFKSRRDSLRERPGLNPNIVCTATYYDAWMPFPERICLELLMDAEKANPQANALNYVSVDGATGDRVTLRDELTGTTYEVQPKIVVNAAGPWIDLANAVLARNTRYIGGTKGSHLMVDSPELYEATCGHEIFFENSDGRIVLFFPLGDKVLMGTTDIPVKDPENVVCSDEEIEYILGMVRKVFPTMKLDRSQVVFHFSGVRPLPTSDASIPGQISRDHSIQVNEAGNGVDFPVLSLVGGKWTTFRAFSEQTADQVLERLGMPRKVDTTSMPIGGGRDYPKTDADRARWIDNLSSETGLARSRVEMLFDRYGTYAAEIAQFSAAEPDDMLHSLPDYSRRELMFLAQRERIVHLDDLLLRRSLLAMTGHVDGDVLEETASILAQTLGWTPDQTAREIDRTIDILTTRNGVSPQRLMPSSRMVTP